MLGNRDALLNSLHKRSQVPLKSTPVPFQHPEGNLLTTVPTAPNNIQNLPKASNLEEFLDQFYLQAEDVVVPLPGHVLDVVCEEGGDTGEQHVAVAPAAAPSSLNAIRRDPRRLSLHKEPSLLTLVHAFQGYPPDLKLELMI